MSTWTAEQNTPIRCDLQPVVQYLSATQVTEVTIYYLRYIQTMYSVRITNSLLQKLKKNTTKNQNKLADSTCKLLIWNLIMIICNLAWHCECECGQSVVSFTDLMYYVLYVSIVCSVTSIKGGTVWGPAMAGAPPFGSLLTLFFWPPGAPPPAVRVCLIDNCNVYRLRTGGC